MAVIKNRFNIFKLPGHESDRGGRCRAGRSQFVGVRRDNQVCVHYQPLRIVATDILGLFGFLLNLRLNAESPSIKSGADL